MSDEAIATIRALCGALATADASVASVAARLGEIIEDQGGALGVTVRPADPQFAEALIVRTYDGGAPAHVRLRPAQADTLSTADLAKAFGSYETPPKARPGSSQTIIFTDDQPGQPYTCTIIVEVSPGPDGVARGAAKTITVRRDTRLP
ncbi:hypothetical protein K2Z83_27030 [Oscillochloris sp. ZM17-4]|uniref:hypothetical protein n=1 Tax=Oscillochloris sp. ZM17-4 TaxID=2866714 RepID=UPI001C72B9C5|nr:hypothetical protein [Oscillochloris sp. ZM17-4]MBX0331309.1 hypothetical protein [Oscillochloris sp. ZM17-4]